MDQQMAFWIGFGIIVLIFAWKKGLLRIRRVTVRRLYVRNMHKWQTYLPRRKKKSAKGCVYVFDFDGDSDASDFPRLADAVSTILDLATENDIAFLTLESPGGSSHAYDDCVAELSRLREAHIPLTISIARIAASGGYHMAATANTIIAKSNAIVGSIGVIQNMMNIRPLLDRIGIHVETVTAGIRKAPNDFCLELTNERREDAQRSVEESYIRFKRSLSELRPCLDVETLATGQIWRAQEAIDLKLIDRIATTSDELRRLEEDGYEIFEVVSHRPPPSLHSDDPVVIITDEIVDTVKRIVGRLG